MKQTAIVLLLVITSYLQVFSQTKDSLSLKIKLARKDVRPFKLDKQRWLEYRNHQIDYTSDYFKPDLYSTSSPNLLTDSTYVRAYRFEALKKTIERRTTGHNILVGTTALIVGSLAALGLAVTIILANG